MSLSPTQRKILYIGVPIVVVLGLYALLKGRSGASTAATGVTTTTAGSASGNTPIGLDQLTSFESQVTAQLGQLGQAISNMQAAQSANPSPPPNSSGYAPPPGSTGQVIGPSVSTGTTSPTPLPGPTNPYSHIPTIGAGSVEAAAGKTIYVEPQPGVYIAAVQNGQWTAAGKAYAKLPGNPGLFLKS